MGRIPVECRGTGIFNSTRPNLKLRLVKHLSLNIRFAALCRLFAVRQDLLSTLQLRLVRSHRRILCFPTFSESRRGTKSKSHQPQPLAQHEASLHRRTSHRFARPYLLPPFTEYCVFEPPMDAQLIWPSFEIDYPQRLPARSRDRRREGAERLLALHTQQVRLPSPTAREILRRRFLLTTSVHKLTPLCLIAMASSCPSSQRPSPSALDPPNDKTLKSKVRIQNRPFSPLFRFKGDKRASRSLQARRLTRFSSTRLHLPRLRPHRGHLRHHHFRPPIPRPGRPSAPQQGRRRVPLKAPALLMGPGRRHPALPRADGLPRQVPGPPAGRQHHEDPEGAGRDQDCAAQDD